MISIDMMAVTKLIIIIAKVLVFAYERSELAYVDVNNIMHESCSS